jgi:cytochrome b561
MLQDTLTQYGLISKLLHWLSAIVIIGMFIVGYWMVDLTYYSQWYKTAPDWHKSIGLLLLLTTIFRLLWKILTPSPKPIATQSHLVQNGAKIAHSLLYLLLLVIMTSGYLISTADDRAIDVFNWFSIPSLGKLFDEQEDISGLIHEYAAYAIMAFALLHAIAALKHHFIDKDATLSRMIK